MAGTDYTEAWGRGLERLEPQFAQVLATIPPFPKEANVFADPSGQALAAARAGFAGVTQHFPPPPEGITSEDVKLKLEKEGGSSELTVRITRKSGTDDDSRTKPALLLVHGGAYVAGVPAMLDLYAQHVVLHTGCVVFSPDYRLAPEHPFPAGLSDVVATLKHIISSAPKYGIDPARISLSGHSAGGDLSILTAAYHSENTLGPPLRRVVLSSPIGIPSAEYPSARQSFTDPTFPQWGWSIASHLGALEAYKASSSGKPPFPYAHTRDISKVTLATLPPTHFHIGELDLFRDEGLAIADLLRSAGVKVTTEVRKGDVHAGLESFMLLPAGQPAFQKVVDILRAE